MSRTLTVEELANLMTLTTRLAAEHDVVNKLITAGTPTTAPQFLISGEDALAAQARIAIAGQSVNFDALNDLLNDLRTRRRAAALLLSEQLAGVQAPPPSAIDHTLVANAITKARQAVNEFDSLLAAS